MFFWSKKQQKFFGNKVIAKPKNLYANLARTCQKNSSEDRFLLALIRQMQRCNASIQFSNGEIFSAKYIAEVLHYFHAQILRIRQNMPLGSNAKLWLSGELLLGLEPQIEISASKIFDYIIEVIDKYPNKSLEVFREQTVAFNERLKNTELFPSAITVNLVMSEEQKALEKERKKYEF